VPFYFINLLPTSLLYISIILAANDLGEGGGRALAEALRLNTTVTSLDLGYNGLGVEVRSALCQSWGDKVTRIILMQHQVNLRGTKKHHDTIRDMMATSSHLFSSISRGVTQWVYGGRLFVVSARTYKRHHHLCFFKRSITHTHTHTQYALVIYMIFMIALSRGGVRDASTLW
jgi:hypothetical protein